MGCGGWERGPKGKGYVYLWLIDIAIWQKPTQPCKTIMLQLKFKKNNKRTDQRMDIIFSKLKPVIYNI